MYALTTPTPQFTKQEDKGVTRAPRNWHVRPRVQGWQVHARSQSESAQRPHVTHAQQDNVPAATTVLYEATCTQSAGNGETGPPERMLSTACTDGNCPAENAVKAYSDPECNDNRGFRTHRNSLWGQMPHRSTSRSRHDLPKSCHSRGGRAVPTDSGQDSVGSLRYGPEPVRDCTRKEAQLTEARGHHKHSL